VFPLPNISPTEYREQDQVSREKKELPNHCPLPGGAPACVKAPVGRLEPWNWVSIARLGAMGYSDKFFFQFYVVTLCAMPHALCYFLITAGSSLDYTDRKIGGERSPPLKVERNPPVRFSQTNPPIPELFHLVSRNVPSVHLPLQRKSLI
jgi:hypothetical protein